MGKKLTFKYFNKKKHKAIVFMNKPINSDDDDIIGINSAVDAIETAIKNGAQMIGVVANYGSGKSSLTCMLSKKTKQKRKPIYINMWDTISRIEQSMDVTSQTSPNGTISLLTKAFVYQLASGIDTQTAQLVNRYLSKNYGILSFSVNSPCFWVMGIIALVFFIFSKLLELFTSSEILHFLLPLSDNIDISTLFDISMFLNKADPLFLCLAMLFGVIGLKNSTIAYSHFKEHKERLPEVNDIFEAYSIVLKKLSKGKIKKRLIIVEDLDRIKNKSLVIGFLKEIYRFNTLNQKNKKTNPVFIISINSESNLETDLQCTPILNENLYSKLFDYTLSLKPIHFSDYAEIMLGIIGDEGSKSRKKLNAVLEENDKIKSNTLPSSFNWLITGHNLTIRQIKDRLNSAVALLISLKNKGYTNQSFVRFSSCAAVSYLEHQYPECFNILLELEENFSNLLNEVIKLKQTHSEKLDEAIANSPKLQKLFDNEKFKNENSISNFQKDIIRMLCNDDITDDFRMYFYSFPKSTYIMNGDERRVCNYLLQPKEQHDYDDLNELIDRINSLNNGVKIINTIKNLANDDSIRQFPKVVLSNESLFLWAFSANKAKLLKTMYKNISWSTSNYRTSLELFKLVFSFCITNSQTTLLLDYISWLTSIFPKFDENHKIAIRKDLYNIAGEKHFSNLFKQLYYGFEKNTSEAEMVGYSLITQDELNDIQNPDTAINLININNITKTNFLPISEYISREIPNEKILLKAEECYLKISQLTTPQTISIDLLNFLTKNRIINYDLLSFVLNEENKTREQYIQISNYVDSLKDKTVPKEIFELLEKHIIDIGLTPFIIKSLKECGLYTALLSYCAKEDKFELVDFFDKTQQENIINAIETIFTYDINIFMSIRLCIADSLARLPALDEEKAISDALYYKNGYPLITYDELQSFDDICKALELLDRSKITEDNYYYIVNFFNESTNINNIVRATNLLLSDEYNDNYKTKSIPANMIKNIKFSEIGFCSLDSNERQKIVDYIGSYVDLTSYENVYNLLLQTGTLIPSLENVLSTKHPQKYIEIIQKIDAPSVHTIEWLKKSSKYIPLPPKTQNRLLEEREFKKYIVAKILHDKRFVFPIADVPNQFIFAEYTPTSPIWEYIRENKDLIDSIIEEEAYVGWSTTQIQQVLQYLHKGIQTYDFVKFILDVLPKQAVSYLITMGKIKSVEDSIKISTLLVQEPYIKYLQEDSVFNTVKEHLWEDVKAHSGHKGLFTKRRNSYFGKNGN